MPEPAVPIEIPNRALFKAAEVCDLLKLQPYVLRSWEAEFPTLGVSKFEGAPRVYRRGDVERVLRIRHLLLVEGLTLAGARRRLEEEDAPVASDEPALNELFGRNGRERLAEVKRGLRSLLELLDGAAGANEFQLAAPDVPVRSAGRPLATTKRHASRGTSARRSAAPPASPRRKRST